MSVPGHERAVMGAQASSELAGTKLPPVAELTVASMVLVISGGIYMAAHMPGHVSLAAPVVLVGLAGAVALAGTALMARVRSFAWGTFFTVAKWALVAYIVITGLLEYVFVLDGTRGAGLAVMTCMLAVFALDVPLLLGFSVARYQEPD